MLPVITLVVYWGTDDWDGALNLRELYGNVDPTLLRYAVDYHVNLISPKMLTPEGLQEFRSSLKQIFTYIKYSQYKEKLRMALQADGGFANMSHHDVELINAVTGSNIRLPSGKERVDVCKAIEDMLDEARRQGIGRGQERSAFNTLKRYERKKIAITEDVLADVAEDNEISMDRVRHIAAENGISLA